MIKPLNDRVLVQMLKQDTTTTKSGIILTSQTEDNPNIAQIVEVGPKTENIFKGQQVIINRYSGTEIQYENDEYIILKQDDILAIID